MWLAAVLISCSCFSPWTQPPSVFLGWLSALWIERSCRLWSLSCHLFQGGMVLKHWILHNPTGVQSPNWVSIKSLSPQNSNLNELLKSISAEILLYDLSGCFYHLPSVRISHPLSFFRRSPTPLVAPRRRLELYLHIFPRANVSVRIPLALFSRI